MVANGCGKLVTSTVLLGLISLGWVENSLQGYLYNILNEGRRFASFKQENMQNYQIINGTITEDGITHFEINEFNPKLKEIRIVEDAYKNIIAMNGVKYVYKRNFYWRTWREVRDGKGNKLLVCYKCQSIMNITCTKCNCGYWEIEENPPCPFEIFSVINNTNICVAYYNQLNNSNSNCSSIISFRDLATCDNPIEIRWRVSPQHNGINVSERYVNVICEKREICEFSTTYSIYPDHITFRIINSSNFIVYSRIMKNDNKNYACLSHCGIFKSKYFTQTKSNVKNTSDFKIISQNYFNHEDSNEDTTKISVIKVNSPIMEPYELMQRKSYNFSKDGATTPTLLCKHLQKTHSEEEYEENEYSYY